MHLRIARVRSKNKTYEYVQLVQGYRRPSDGKPTHRLIAKLGKLSDLEIANLRAALAASREHNRVVVATASHGPQASPPTANLRFLDLAVLLELWRQWGLDELLAPILPVGEAHVPPAAVVCALALQRCVAPGSKLRAARWFPRTSLPELLGIRPKSFNNTRVHRVLDALDEATPALMRKLPRLYAKRDGAFAAMFMDVTDTWFVGHGPDMAQRSTTKEGRVERKVGIVLLCNEHGYPLRWKVIEGKCADNTAMGEMLQSIRGLSWLGSAPIVCDRAMGKTAQIRQMLANDLHFLTALTRPEFSAYSKAVPHQPFADFQPIDGAQYDDEQRKQAIEEASRRAEAAGLTKVADDLWVLDLGTIERSEDEPAELLPRQEQSLEATVEAMRLARAIEEAVADGSHSSYAAAGRALGLRKTLALSYRKLCRLAPDVQRDILDGRAAGVPLDQLRRIATIEQPQEQREAFGTAIQQRPDRIAKAMRLGRALEQAVAEGHHRSYRAASEAMGLSDNQTRKFRRLCRLPEDIQRDILDGRAARYTLTDLLRVAQLEQADKQRQAFEALLRGPSNRRAAPASVTPRDSDQDKHPVRVRAVVYFNPEILLQQRLSARRTLARIEKFVEELNRRLASPRSQMKRDSIAGHVNAALRRENLIQAFDVNIARKKLDVRKRYQVTLTLKTDDWVRRRRYDGFSMLVAHPEVVQDPAELCRLYRSKDAVEKDFEVIKSFIKLRPLWHKTDLKVRAHVTICMLALLLERTLRRKLGSLCTAQAALEELASCHLNCYEDEKDAPAAYLITRPDTAQSRILRALRLHYLTDNEELADQITPR